MMNKKKDRLLLGGGGLRPVQSGRGTTKGSASLPVRTRWTSWTCLVCGATIVDCNGGRRGRTTFKYVTGKVTITMRVGRLSTGA